MIVNTVCRHASHIIPRPVDARARFFGSSGCLPAPKDAGGTSSVARLAEEGVDIVVVSSCECMWCLADR